MAEKEFDKYKKRGSLHWKEMESKDPRVFNAFQQARYDWILKLARDIKGKKILDLGCGDGSLTYILASKGASVTGVDNEELGLEFARQNLKERNRGKSLTYEFINASVYSLPFMDEEFDMVITCEVIEHLADPDKMLSELSRVLKSGGKFILTTPYRLTEIPADQNHVKEYYPGEILKMVENYFIEAEVKPTHHVLWRSLYTHAFRSFGNRPLGRWMLNIPILLFGWNPFMIDYTLMPNKFDTFSSICASGNKK